MKILDKITLRSLILDLRAEGKSFQDISNILENEYSIKKSRQAICAMYNRLTSDTALNKNADELLRTSDILNYKAIGLSTEQIRRIISANGYEATSYYIEDIIKQNTSYSKRILAEQVAKVADILRRNGDYDAMIMALSYKNEKPTQSLIKEVVRLASSEILKSRAIDLMVKVINITDDTSIIRSLNKTHNFKISLKEVSTAMNNIGNKSK